MLIALKRSSPSRRDHLRLSSAVRSALLVFPSNTSQMKLSWNRSMCSIRMSLTRVKSSQARRRKRLCQCVKQKSNQIPNKFLNLSKTKWWAYLCPRSNRNCQYQSLLLSQSSKSSLLTTCYRLRLRITHVKMSTPVSWVGSRTGWRCRGWGSPYLRTSFAGLTFYWSAAVRCWPTTAGTTSWWDWTYSSMRMFQNRSRRRGTFLW